MSPALELEKINKRVFLLIEEVNAAGEDYAQRQYDYDQRKAELTLSEDTSGFKRAEEREAAVTLALESEDLTYPLVKARTKWKRLMNEKESLSDIASNLRVISMGMQKSIKAPHPGDNSLPEIGPEALNDILNESTIRR